MFDESTNLSQADGEGDTERVLGDVIDEFDCVFVGSFVVAFEFEVEEGAGGEIAVDVAHLFVGELLLRK